MTIPPSLIEAVSTWATAIGLVFVGILGQKNAKNAKKVAKEAKDTANAVADNLTKSNEKRDESFRQIHLLVNGAMGNVLRRLMFQAEMIASLTGKPEHLAAAIHAREEYESHMTRQRHVDSIVQQTDEKSK